MIILMGIVGYIFKKYIMTKCVLQGFLMKNLNIVKKIPRLKDEFIITLN